MKIDKLFNNDLKKIKSKTTLHSAIFGRLEPETIFYYKYDKNLKKYLVYLENKESLVFIIPDIEVIYFSHED